MDKIFPIVLIILIFMRIFTGSDEKGKQRYFVVATLILGILLVTRLPNVGSDLGRYKSVFFEANNLEFSEIWGYNRNPFFYYWMNIVGRVFNKDYQAFISITAIFCFLPPVMLIKRYSRDPYYSIIAFFCLGFYIFLFSGLKQAMAMAILCFAFQAGVEKKTIKFLLLVILAAQFHMSALCFAPVILIANRHKTKSFFLYYFVGAIIVFLFRQEFVQIMTDQYDSVVSSISLVGVGGKVIFIGLIGLAGYLLCTPNDSDNPNMKLIYYKFMIIAAIIQLFAVFGNVFERLADYYFFYVVLYIPEILYSLQYEGGCRENIVDLNSSFVPIVKVSVLIILVVYFIIYSLATPGLSVYKSWLF